MGKLRLREARKSEVSELGISQRQDPNPGILAPELKLSSPFPIPRPGVRFGRYFGVLG